MNIQLVARSDEVTQEHKDHATQRVGKLQRFFDQIHSIEVVLDVDQHACNAEIVLAAGRDHVFVSEVSCGDLMVAIDQAVNKLQRQITRFKERIKNHRPRRSSALLSSVPSEGEEGSMDGPESR